MKSVKKLTRNSNSWIAFRFTPEAQVNSLMHARSCGFYDVPAGWCDKTIRKEFLQLFWCISGELEFCCEKKRWKIGPGEVCYYFPGDLHLIEAQNSGAVYFWLTVDGADVQQIISAFGISREPRMAGKCPSTLFLQLREYIIAHTASGEMLAGSVAFEIISRSLIYESGAGKQMFRHFAAYVEKNLSNPEAGIKDCAAGLKCHRSTLTRCVKQISGLSPVEYIVAARLRMALALLRDSNLSIKEIACQCGFNDPGYFARVINRQYGMSPHELRGSDIDQPPGVQRR